MKKKILVDSALTNLNFLLNTFYNNCFVCELSMDRNVYPLYTGSP